MIGRRSVCFPVWSFWKMVMCYLKCIIQLWKDSKVSKLVDFTYLAITWTIINYSVSMKLKLKKVSILSPRVEKVVIPAHMVFYYIANKSYIY